MHDRRRFRGIRCVHAREGQKGHIESYSKNSIVLTHPTIPVPSTSIVCFENIHESFTFRLLNRPVYILAIYYSYVPKTRRRRTRFCTTPLGLRPCHVVIIAPPLPRWVPLLLKRQYCLRWRRVTRTKPRDDGFLAKLCPTK